MVRGKVEAFKRGRKRKKLLEEARQDFRNLRNNGEFVEWVIKNELTYSEFEDLLEFVLGRPLKLNYDVPLGDY